MGAHHIQTHKGVIFNAPYARRNDYQNTNRSVGTIVRKRFNDPLFRVAGGNWKDEVDQGDVINDPHRLDKTGAAIVEGKFFDADGLHLAIGAPNADNLHGKVYICKDCFARNQNWVKRNSKEVKVEEGGQVGEQFGSAIAAVNIRGDANHVDLVIGAPLYSKRVGMNKIIWLEFLS